MVALFFCNIRGLKMFKTAKWIGAERILEKKTDYLSPAVMLRKRFVLTDLNNKD